MVEYCVYVYKGPYDVIVIYMGLHMHMYINTHMHTCVHTCSWLYIRARTQFGYNINLSITT